MSHSRKDALYTECAAKLRAEFLDALMQDPQRVIRTPGFAHINTASQVLYDSLSGIPDDGRPDPMHEVIGILAAGANGEDVQLRIQLFMELEARKHADYHAQDMADELMGDEVTA